MAKRTVGDIRDILSETFNINSCGGICFGEETCEDFGFTSPLGEDFTFTLWYEDNAESFSEALTKYAEDFDPERHAAMWFNNGDPKPGTPSSLEDLLTDAKAIKIWLKMAAGYVEAYIEGKTPELSSPLDGFVDRLTGILAEYPDMDIARTDEGLIEVKNASFNVGYGGKTYTVMIKDKEGGRI